MIRTVSVLFSFSLLLVLAGCSHNPISYDNDYKQGVDFGKYKTYTWHTPNEHNESSEAYVANEIVDERIRSSVDKVLSGKGFKKVDSGAVDFTVNYSIITKDKVDVRTYNTYNGYGWGYGYGGTYGMPYRYYGVGYRSISPDQETQVTHYTQGTFVLDVVSGDEQKLVWRGTAEGRMRKSKLTPSEREQVIDDVVTNVLSGFPPPKAK